MDIENEYRKWVSQMSIASLKSRMLMHAYKPKKRRTGDAKTLFDHNRTWFITTFSFVILNSQSWAVYTWYRISTLTKAHRTFNDFHSMTRCISPCVQPNSTARKALTASTISPGHLMQGMHTCPTGYEIAHIWRSFRSLEVDNLESWSLLIFV